MLRSGRSLNSIGHPCFNLTPKGSSLDKRQASLILCIRAEGEQLVRLGIIFRGTGQRISLEEEQAYRKLGNVLYIFWQVHQGLLGFIMMF